MATHFSMFLLLSIAGSFSSLYAEIRKELRTKEVNNESILQLGRPIQSNRVDPSHVADLSWQPRVFLYKAFLSDEECDRLVSQARGKKESFVETGHDSVKVVDTIKLPTSVDISSHVEDEIIEKIEERISAWTFLPKENGKPLQVRHFGLEDAQQSYSYFGNNSRLEASEPLIATVVLYLSTVTLGGQVLFPDSESKNPQAKNKIWSDCTKSSHMLKPTKGNAILIFNLLPNGTPDGSSSHARCPVLEGEMWFATKLFYVRTLTEEKVQTQPVDNDCTDEDENCPRWVSMGECEKNPVFMVGSPDYYGTCRKSCNAC